MFVMEDIRQLMAGIAAQSQAADNGQAEIRAAVLTRSDDGTVLGTVWVDGGVASFEPVAEEGLELDPDSGDGLGVVASGSKYRG